MIPGKPSETAQIVCLIRALDAAWLGKRSLICDVYAKRFLSAQHKAAYLLNANPAGRAGLLPIRWLHNWIVMRHAFIDRLVRECGPRMPVVLLGAGYDSRAWRLADSIAHGIYEIDFASTQERKRTVAAKAGIQESGAIFIQADFANESLTEIFERTGLRSTPALVIWEGVTMYLAEPIVRGTIHQAGEFFGPGSMLLADFWTGGPDTPRRRRAVAGASRIARGLIPEPFLFGTSPSEVQSIAGDEGVPSTEISGDTAISASFAVRRSLIPSPYFVGTFRY